MQHPLPSLPPNLQSVLAATKIEVSLKENLKAKGVPKPLYVSEMQENGAERWVERYLEDSKDLEAPCVLLHLGLSATLYYVSFTLGERSFFERNLDFVGKIKFCGINKVSWK